MNLNREDSSYIIPDGCGTGELTEKRSRFIGQLWPVDSEEEARSLIAEAKKKYYDARHNCWCYRLRDDTERYSDDGEPQGTAGQPMLNLFRGEEVTGVCCVVTRYFGGVLLGTGGLARAYTAAARLALDAAGKRRMALWRCLDIPCPYRLYERVRRLLEDRGAVIENCDFGADARIAALIRGEQAEAFAAELRELTGGSVAAEIGGECFRGVKIS